MNTSQASESSQSGRVRTPRAVFKRMVAGIAIPLLAVTGALIGSAPAHAFVDALHGQVTDAVSHVGIANVVMFILNKTTHAGTSEVTDGSGYYHFTTIPSDGDYTLTVNSGSPVAGYATEYYNSTPFFALASPISLTSTSNVDVSVALPHSGGISGTVSSADSTHAVVINILALNPVSDTWQSVANSSFALGAWNIDNLLPGSYKVLFMDVEGPPYYVPEYYNNIAHIEDAELVTVTAGNVTTHVDTQLSLNPPVTRIGGADRFETSALIAAKYDSASVVFVANGLGFPDALSAAPAAAFYNAPLLLTQQNSLPAAVKAQVVRLHPQDIAVIGGTGVVSDAVFNELNVLAPGHVHRISGVDRYATSKAVFESFWDGYDAPTVFLADGRNYPDALASASAASYLSGPVVLVNGGSSSIPMGLGTTLSAFNTTHVALAGGSAVLSDGIATTAAALPGMTVNRYFGANRYATSLAINAAFISYADTVYLAVGTGFADALSGAALAGSQGAPLYLVPGNCVPQNVLDAIDQYGATSVVLLGGTGVLSAAVGSLTSCTT
ncbi:putative cell wall-binding protein [Cryobacterium mesophilum]|uniref:Cell wall binding repeat 2 n=1 Tax=Terrimesophilobacter mesophilus TaxID=433647 RepID=A0A4R8VCL7_9MICO|nr:cell wall-binding repeat-containing protein [Terrimesophilobacter mesophilus]MBB5633914.1 putative cell wall-binding protein [Terrimesophilobacter mesophilus]TFB80583.1 hypothetical protein E3N84_11395 [Terrimesophilobacter mesophilus]